MENASKALIIAGAILISILLISVGIIVMNAINDPISQAGSSAESQAIEIFNSKFTAYIGSELDYNAVKSLFSTITAVNGSAEVKADANRKIIINKGATSSEAAPSKASDLKKSATYKVEIEDLKPDKNVDGYYESVTINKN